MDPILFVVAIMGCGDGQAGCTEARVVRAQYETIAECQLALPDMLAANTDIPFPEISATCRRDGAQYARAGVPRPRG